MGRRNAATPAITASFFVAGARVEISFIAVR